MSDRDHAEAMRLYEAICHEMGVRASFPTVVVCALENLLSDIIAAKVAIEEPDPLPERTLPAGRWN